MPMLIPAPRQRRARTLLGGGDPNGRFAQVAEIRPSAGEGLYGEWERKIAAAAPSGDAGANGGTLSEEADQAMAENIQKLLDANLDRESIRQLSQMGPDAVARMTELVESDTVEPSVLGKVFGRLMSIIGPYVPPSPTDYWKGRQPPSVSGGGLRG